MAPVVVIVVVMLVSYMGASLQGENIAPTMGAVSFWWSEFSEFQLFFAIPLKLKKCS